MLIYVEPNLRCSVIAPCFCKRVAILPGIDAMSPSGFGYWVAKRVRRAEGAQTVSVALLPPQSFPQPRPDVLLGVEVQNPPGLQKGLSGTLLSNLEPAGTRRNPGGARRNPVRNPPALKESLS